MKKLKVIILIFLAIIILLSAYIFNSPYEKIGDYNEDFGMSPFTYLHIYKKVFPKKKFEKLVERLITENTDIKSINITAEFCRIEKLYEYIPIIEQKCKLLESFPKDSIWVVRISNSITRQSAASQIKLANSICENLARLKELKVSDSAVLNKSY